MTDPNKQLGDAEGGGSRQTGIKIPTPWGPVEVRGLGTILTLVLLVICFNAYIAYEGKAEHTSIVTSVGKVQEAMAEQTYVLSLKQEDRENLNITMPPTLRAKIRRGDQ